MNLPQPDLTSLMPNLGTPELIGHKSCDRCQMVGWRKEGNYTVRCEDCGGSGQKPIYRVPQYKVVKI